MDLGRRTAGSRPIFVPCGVEISKNCSWNAHIAKIIGKGKAQIGKMNAVLTDSNLDTRNISGVSS